MDPLTSHIEPKSVTCITSNLRSNSKKARQLKSKSHALPRARRYVHVIRIHINMIKGPPARKDGE